MYGHRCRCGKCFSFPPDPSDRGTREKEREREINRYNEKETKKQTHEQTKKEKEKENEDKPKTKETKQRNPKNTEHQNASFIAREPSSGVAI